MKNQKPFRPMKEFFVSKFGAGYASAIAGYTLAFIIPLAPFLIFVTLLVFADLYTGVRAARMRKEVIHSKGLRRSVEKIVVYFIAILASQGMIQVFQIPFNLTYIVAFAIALAEFKSLIENSEKITGVNIWTLIMDRMNLLKGKGGKKL